MYLESINRLKQKVGKLEVKKVHIKVHNDKVDK